MLIPCNIHLRYIIPWYAQLSFSIKESDDDVKLNWKTSMIFISGIIRIIIQKDTLCTNWKICDLFLPRSSQFYLPENAQFFIFCFILFYVTFFFFTCPQLVRLCAKLPLFLTIICNRKWIFKCVLTLSWRRSLSYRNQSIDLRVSIW